MLEINEHIFIPLAEFAIHYVRSSGPGGQNVNKVATKAVLKWTVSTTPSLPEAVRARFIQRFSNRINSVGELVLSSDRHRSQGRNADDCLEKLRALVLEVVKPPAPRKKTRPTAGAKRRRLEGKKRQAKKKQSRRQVRSDDE